MQGIQARAAANILAAHLSHDNLRVGENVKGLRVEGYRILQGFEQSDIFGNVVILVANPLRNANRAAIAPVNHNSNAGRPRISQGATIHVGHKIRHHCVSATCKMRSLASRVKMIIWFAFNLLDMSFRLCILL